MAQINAYLKFDGNCREAMTFYKECFGGELIFNTVKGSPLEGFMKSEEGKFSQYAISRHAQKLRVNRPEI